ncbi:MAG: hypothetical protein H7840_09775 [Alphaproteobacteria bacterium]
MMRLSAAFRKVRGLSGKHIARRALLRLVPLLLLGAATAGCPALPQPFKPEFDDNPLTLLRSGVGVVVRPAEGVPDPTRTALALAMARALTRAEIPASVLENSNEPLRYVLRPAVYELLRDESGLRLAIIWSLGLQGDSRTVEDLVRITVDEARWRVGDPAYLQEAVGAPSRRFIALLNETPVTAAAKTAAPVAPTVAVSAITGLPEDGNAALATAMREALRRSGLDVRENGEYQVTCRVTLEPLASRGKSGDRRDGRMMKVEWTVTTSDGAVLGNVSQRNEVPMSMLRPPWTGLVGAVASGGADGIGEVVKRRHRDGRGPRR